MTIDMVAKSVEDAIKAIPASGLANGTPYSNTAVPSTSHVRAHLKWPLNADGSQRTLVDAICRYAKVDLGKAARDAVVDKAEVEIGVIVAIARLAAVQFYGWKKSSFHASETVVIAASTANLHVHADHVSDVAAALEKWAGPATRYMALFYYNSISYEQFNHHHLPAVTKKLATTTILLSGLKDFIANEPEREGSIFHDMFHPLSDTEKSNAARRVGAKAHLSAMKFDNLRKRLPVKAPDSGIALNYAVLCNKAKGYAHNPVYLPDSLNPPANLAEAITAYEKAAKPADVTEAVAKLRVLSDALTEPSAYLAGFILGCEARVRDDPELELKTAARTTTILGSPAYARAAGEFSGTFATAKENAMKKVPATTVDQVLPRCAAQVSQAATL